SATTLYTTSLEQVNNANDHNIESVRLATIPAIQFQGEGRGCFAARDIESIIIDSKFACSRDEDGHTLIPPTLAQFAETFQNDAVTALGIRPRLFRGTDALEKSIFITLSKNITYSDAAGRSSSEGYMIKVDENGVTIAAASPLGAWWGTRTLLQVMATSNGCFPYGRATDSPGWTERGVMLDVGRHYYPPDFLIEMCSFLSYFKQNVFHLHLSDNLFVNHELQTEKDMWELYSGFRLSSTEPNVAGLASPANESYTRLQFEEIQQRCAQRGVTIILEINSPAHALAIAKWKPEIALEGDPTMLNISHPETLPTVKSIWQTFIPWFHSKTVHLGADEYSDKLVAEYSRYVDELVAFVSSSGKNARIWGTFPARQGGNYTKDVDIQHWAPYEDNPYFDFIKNGYKVLNSDFAFYINTKWHGYFPQTLNSTLIFNGDPNGGPYRPYIFDTRNATNNPPSDEPAVLGHIAAQWSDYGPSASTYLEAYYSWRDYLPALADKAWGGDLSEKEYESIVDELIISAPGQNLDRRIQSETDVIFDYHFDAVPGHQNQSQAASEIILDRSGNGHDATNRGCIVNQSAIHFSNGCFLETPLSSKGRNYSLSFWIKPENSAGPAMLFSGSDSALYSGYGNASNITLVSGTQPYFLNYTLPVGKWSHVVLSGHGKRTFFTVSEERSSHRTMEVLVKVEPNGVPGSNGVMSIWMPIALEAPLKWIGDGFNGLMRNISLVNGSNR
ncbi:unnamed protein product, partial [Clonostachys byssicola]